MSASLPTKRLYLADSLLLSFEARVVSHGTYRDRPSVIVDQTAFYPESGGQPADQGMLGGQPVEDVQVDQAGVIHHLVSPPLPALGSIVRGTIAEARRRVHMAQHTGQHLLSQALLRVANAPTRSSRLGSHSCTIDVGCSRLSPEQVAAAESLVDRMVEQDLPVKASIPPPEVLSRLPLRRRPKVSQGIRVVEVGDFECVPCGGTHCTRTSQVGLLTILSAERYKGNCRVTFVAGQHARSFHHRHFRVLQSMGHRFSCQPTDVPRAVDKLQRERDAAREALGRVRQRLAAREAAALLARHPDGPCVATLNESDVELLRAVAQQISAQPTGVALLAAPQDLHWTVVLARGTASTFDCGALMRRLAAATQGQGGGRPDRAEGRLPRHEDWPALVEAHLSEALAPAKS